MNSPFFEARNLTKCFQDKKSLDHVSFSIPQGKILALCGGNGAGKSTLIKIITGILSPTEGELMMNGQTVNTKSIAYKTMFSYMPDRMLFHPQLTGYEVLKFFAKLRGLSENRVITWIEKVGLTEALHKQVKHYSKGMQQRLSLAQALMSDTPFIILDEPTNGLDPYWVFVFKNLLKEEKQKGKTILFSTHILSIVEELADEAVFLDQGKVLASGTINEIVNNGSEGASLEDVFFRNTIL
jgi:ABC-type multidrug transport system ATPase subunit